MPDRHYHVVLNPNSGTALALGLTGDTLRERFEREGLTATVDADGETPLRDRIAAAIAGDADVVVAAGGDGTITALAEAIIGSGKTLAMLPTGTANLLARDLGIPLDLDQAIAGLRDMVPHNIDVGEVNGRAFLHNVTIGLIPGIAVGREQIRGRSDLGALLGFARYFVRRVTRARRLAVQISVDGGAPRVERVQALSVSNNAYDEAFGHVFTRQALDGGHLNLHTLKHLTVIDMVRLTAGMVVGRWQDHEAITVEGARTVQVVLKRETVMAMLDGEIESLTVPLDFRILPKALPVLVPAPADPVPAEVDLPEYVVGI